MKYRNLILKYKLLQTARLKHVCVLRGLLLLFCLFCTVDLLQTCRTKIYSWSLLRKLHLLCIVYSESQVPVLTSVCSWASTAGCPWDREVVIQTQSSGKCNCFIWFYFNVVCRAFEGEQRFVLAFPFLEVTLAVTIIRAYFTSNTFALCSQALSGWYNEKPITARPTHVEAAVWFFNDTETSGLVNESKWGICKRMWWKKKCEQCCGTFKERLMTVLSAYNNVDDFFPPLFLN